MTNIIKYNFGEQPILSTRHQPVRIVFGQAAPPLFLYTIENPLQVYNYGPCLSGQDAILVNSFDDSVTSGNPTQKYVIPSREGLGLLIVNLTTGEFELVNSSISESNFLDWEKDEIWFIDFGFGMNSDRTIDIIGPSGRNIYDLTLTPIAELDFPIQRYPLSRKIGPFNYSFNDNVGANEGFIITGSNIDVGGPPKGLNFEPFLPNTVDFPDIKHISITPYGDIVLFEKLDFVGSFNFAIHVIDSLFVKDIPPSGPPPNFLMSDGAPFIVHTFLSQYTGIGGPIDEPEFILDEAKEDGLGWGFTTNLENKPNIDYLPDGDMIIADLELGKNETGNFEINNANSFWPRVRRISLRTGKIKWSKYTPGEDLFENRVSGLFVDEGGNIVCSLQGIPGQPETNKLWVLDSDGDELHVQDLNVANLNYSQKPIPEKLLSLRIVFNISGNANASWRASEHEDHFEYVVFLNNQEVARTVNLNATIEELNIGSEYTFKVASVDEFDVELMSSSFTDTVEILPPSIIKDLDSTFENSEITLLWNDPKHGNTGKINIYVDDVLLVQVDPGIENYSFNSDPLQEKLIQLKVENEAGEIGGSIEREDTPYLTFYEDFTDTNVGDFPTGWTLQNPEVNVGTPEVPDWQANDFTIRVEFQPLATNGKVLRFTPGSAYSQNFARVSYDVLDGYNFLELEIRWRPLVDPADGVTVGMKGVFTGSGNGSDGYEAGWTSINPQTRQFVGGQLSLTQKNGNDWSVTVLRINQDEFGFHELKRQEAGKEIDFTLSESYNYIEDRTKINYLELFAAGISGGVNELGEDYNEVEIDYVKARIIEPE